MYERYRNFALRWLKVPPQPHPPLGDPASLRVFRAGRNFFKLRVLRWGAAQLLVLAGIVFWAVVLLEVETAARAQKQAAAGRPASPDQMVENIKSAAGAPTPKNGGKNSRGRIRINGWSGFLQALVELAVRLPDWAFPVLWALKILSFAVYVAQIPVTYALRRLDYEMRWYMVTDRSLRIRTGVSSVQELTMSFANLQQVTVAQGPIQRLLGISDVRVKSAGGGGMPVGHGHEPADQLHTAIFHGVDNASEIRDLILDRLRHFRAAGLGDPDDHRELPPSAATAKSAAALPDDALDAAQELLAEARALRASVTGASAPLP